jgi:hypothetical protein
MRKIFFTVITLLAMTMIKAQQKPASIAEKPFLPTSRIGFIAGGLDFNYIDYHDKITTIEGKNTNFHAGFFFQENIAPHFAIQPNLRLSMRGGKINDIDSTINVHLLNIELPVNFLYTYKGFMAGGGPSFHYGIKGKIKVKDKEGNAYDEPESMHLALKRFEFGADLMIGYTFKKGIFITGNFSPGLTNIYKGDGSAPGNVKAKTRSFGIAVGYMFRSQ